MKPAASPPVPVLILLLALLPAALDAVSVFDVIRLSQGGYSDAEIVRLIQTTDSRFVLSAEDTVRLRSAGVTESVIREMLSRPAPQRDSGPPASESAPIPSRPSAGKPLFSGSPYREKSGDREEHAAVTIGGIEVLILRDAAELASPLARARAVAQTLNGLASTASGRFAVRAGGRGSKVIFESSEGAATDVINVTPADVAAYRAEGHRQVSSGALTSFWAALLSDYWAIGVTGQPPRDLIDTRGGQSLERLAHAVRLPVGPRGGAAVRDGFDSLGSTDREFLRKLPTAVPEDLQFPMRRSP